jgi:hypothetical protein
MPKVTVSARFVRHVLFYALVIGGYILSARGEACAAPFEFKETVTGLREFPSEGADKHQESFEWKFFWNGETGSGALDPDKEDKWDVSANLSPNQGKMQLTVTGIHKDGPHDGDEGESPFDIDPAPQGSIVVDDVGALPKTTGFQEVPGASDIEVHATSGLQNHRDIYKLFYRRGDAVRVFILTGGHCDAPTAPQNGDGACSFPPTLVPQPSSITLLILGAFGLLARRRRRNQGAE